MCEPRALIAFVVNIASTRSTRGMMRAFLYMHALNIVVYVRCARTTHTNPAGGARYEIDFNYMWHAYKRDRAHTTAQHPFICGALQQHLYRFLLCYTRIA